MKESAGPEPQAPQGHAAAPQAPGAWRRNSAEDGGAEAPPALINARTLPPHPDSCG
jgi:hypothetical protein